MSRPRLIVALVGAALLFGGCSATAATEPVSTPSTSAVAAYPRTVTVGDQEITLTQEVTRIVPMSWEVSDLALTLAGPDRLAAVSDGSLSADSGNYVDLAQQVDTVLPYTTDPDPEQILALNPDLVLLVARHGGEETIVSTLESSGVPAVVFSDSDFSSPDALIDSITTLGELFGTEQAAEQASSDLAEQIDEVVAAVSDVSDRPRVLVLMARGPKVMEQSADSTLSVLVEMAGGTSIATEQGLAQTITIDAETVVAANPDVILVEDFRGAGLAPFESLLSSPAVAAVPAVADQRISSVSTTIASSTATTHLGEGLRTVAELLHPQEMP